MVMVEVVVVVVVEVGLVLVVAQVVVVVVVVGKATSLVADAKWARALRSSSSFLPPTL